MRTGEAGLNLIKGFEGLRMQSYYTPSEQWSVGYGHTGSAHHGMAVSEGQADMLLKRDIEPVERLIDETVMTPLNRNEHDALVSFIFNVGADNFRRSSVLRRLNAGDRLGAADAMEMWSKAHVNGELVKEPYVQEVDHTSYVSTVVGPSAYFVLGDNRPRSSDSREFGLVPASYLRGRVDLRLWPLSRAGFLQ